VACSGPLPGNEPLELTPENRVRVRSVPAPGAGLEARSCAREKASSRTRSA
jgi:hypothetical protein